MDASRSRIRILMALGAGVVVGWTTAFFRPQPIQASAGDRAGECIVTTGAVLQQYDDNTKAAIPLDALYYLDYKGGRLIATVPSFRSDGKKTQLLDNFAERDLVADFKLDVEGGPRPRFLMTTGSLGRYTAGWAPLYVFETTTSQIAVYKVQVGQAYGSDAPVQFDLVELRRYTKSAAAPPRR